MKNDNVNIVEKAKIFATQKHADQTYGEGAPYTFHLGKVVSVLQRFGVQDLEILAAAWLHDTVEDTGTTIAEISNLFGPRIADLVFRVSNEPGKNRAERHTKTYPKIKASKDAIQLKLGDRIANVEHSIENRSGFFNMYRKDHQALVDALRTNGEFDDMWNHLENLMNVNARRR